MHGAGTALQLLEQLQLSPVDSTEYFMVTNRSREEDADPPCTCGPALQLPSLPSPSPQQAPSPATHRAAEISHSSFRMSPLFLLNW